MNMMEENNKKVNPLLLSLLIFILILATVGAILLIIYQKKSGTASVNPASMKVEFVDRGEKFFIEKFSKTSFAKGGGGYPGGLENFSIKLVEEEQNLFSMSENGVKLISVGLENTPPDQQLTVLVNIKEALLSNRNDLNFWLSTLILQALYSREPPTGLEGQKGIAIRVKELVLAFKKEHERYPLELTDLKL